MKTTYLFLGAIIFTLCLVNVQSVFAELVPENKTTLPPPENTTHLPSSNQSTPSLQNPLKADNIEKFLLSMVDLAIFIGVILAVLMFIYIGFKFVLAQGDPKKLKDAKDWFLYAVIGTAVLISSKVIVEVIKTTFISAGVVNENYFKK